MRGTRLRAPMLELEGSINDGEIKMGEFEEGARCGFEGMGLVESGIQTDWKSGRAKGRRVACVLGRLGNAAACFRCAMGVIREKRGLERETRIRGSFLVLNGAAGDSTVEVAVLVAGNCDVAQFRDSSQRIMQACIPRQPYKLNRINIDVNGATVVWYIPYFEAA